jgi:hypothetical protein
VVHQGYGSNISCGAHLLQLVSQTSDTVERDVSSNSPSLTQTRAFCRYFGKNFFTSLGYCTGKCILVFAILRDRSGITTETKDFIVVHKPEHQIPLFTVRFS